MITLLSKLFIKDSKNYLKEEVRSAYGILCSIVGIVLNFLLFLMKFIIGIITASITTQADSFNNLSDSGSSFLSLLGFKMSGKKPSDERPFGEGRFEYISGLLIACLIIVIGVNTLRDAITSLIERAETEVNLALIIILTVSILVKLYMAFYNRSIGKKISSVSMKAVSNDSLTDVLSTFLALVCALIKYYSGLDLDGYCAIAISILLIYVGFSTAKETINDLLGKRPEKDFVDKIKSIVMSYDEIIGIHDLVVHDYGVGKTMISLHAEVSGDSDIYLLHEVIDSAMSELDEKLNCVSVIHMDPICLSDEKTTEMRQSVSELVKQIDERITIHDFRMVVGPTHTNFIFDAVIPHDIKLSDSEIKNKISTLISQNYENVSVVIQLDRSYV